MIYKITVIIIAMCFFLCGCKQNTFSSPEYAVVENNNAAGIGNVDGYRIQQHKEKEEIISCYYVNKNTKKFHKPTCPYALKMNETSTLLIPDRDFLIDQNYTPCGHCKP
ncbi:MAG: hypothetical protein IJ946_05530 [Clostridia bacterium]|nr:hypothetical protein [Clostridia bacterium]